MDEIVEFDIPHDKSVNIIKVIGVGGGGSNAVKNMYRQGVYNVSFAICNTDSQALARADIPVRIQLGKVGLGVCNAQLSRLVIQWRPLDYSG